MGVGDAFGIHIEFEFQVEAGSRSTNTSWWMMNHCSSTPARGRCFHWCVKR